MIWQLGKLHRMRNLLDESGLIIAVPMDHGYTLGPVKGLEDISSTVQSVFQGGASCVVVQKGMVRRLTNSIPKGRGLMVHISGSTAMSPKGNVKIQSGSVETAIRMGADGVSCHVNVGPDEDYLMLEDLNRFSEDAEIWGMPLMAMMYARDNKGLDDKSVESISHIARIAEEANADIIKVNMTDEINRFDEVIQGVKVPVVVAGGSKSDNFEEFLENIRKCIILGASGISVGRNIFQAKDPILAMKKLKKGILEAVDEVGPVDIL